MRLPGALSLFRMERVFVGWRAALAHQSAYQAAFSINAKLLRAEMPHCRQYYIFKLMTQPPMGDLASIHGKAYAMAKAA